MAGPKPRLSLACIIDWTGKIKMIEFTWVGRRSLVLGSWGLQSAAANGQTLEVGSHTEMDYHEAETERDAKKFIVEMFA